MHQNHRLSLRTCIAGLCIVLLVFPASAFTAQSLTITVEKNGNATAVFQYALEGFVENAIPESVLKEELVKGLATSDEPPEVTAFDKSGATLSMKKFARLSDTATGTEYVTASMNFSVAEEALKESSVSSLITADFTPRTTTVIFPDGYREVFTDSSLLPSLRHVVIDPEKMAAANATAQNNRAATTVAGSPSGTGAIPTPETGGESSSAIPVVIGIVILLALAGAGAYYYKVYLKK